MPPTLVGTPPSEVSVEPGATKRIENVLQYFNESEGEVLTITFASDAVDVATVESVGLDNDVLITAVADGTATVTITATDEDDKTASFDIVVTVAVEPPVVEPPVVEPPVVEPPVVEPPVVEPPVVEPPVVEPPVVEPPVTPPKDPRLNITLPGETGDDEVDLDDYLDDDEDAEDYELVPDHPRHFTVALIANSTSVWKITPKHRGIAKAYIRHKASATNKQTITVTIDNRRPAVNPKTTVETMDLVAPSTSTRSKEKNEDGDPDEYNLRLYSATIMAKQYFKDDDAEDADKLMYNFKSSRTDVDIAKGDECMTASCALEIDVIDGTNAGVFDLILTATDPADGVSEPVTIPVRLMPPLGQTYLVDQHSKGLEHMTVGYRNAKHTMVLGGWPDDADDDSEDEVGFFFAEAGIAKKKSADGTAAVDPNTSISATTIGVMTTVPSDADSSTAPDNQQVIVIKAGGRVNDLAATDLTWAQEANPMLMFSVSGPGPGTIKLTYYVWADKDGKADADVTPDTLDVETWTKAAEATISVTVK